MLDSTHLGRRLRTGALIGLRAGMLIGSMLVGALLAAGCVLPPKEAPRPRSLQADRIGLTGSAVAPTPTDWWSSFQDPQLDRLIRRGLENSPTLAQARARVTAALAEADSAHSKLLPSASLDASALYQRAPQEYVIPQPLAGHTFWMGQAGATLGWDLDLWGRQADALQGSRDLARAARFDEDHARLMLAGAIAHTYVELYRENALADIALRSEAQRQNIVDITRRRVKAGLDTQLEVRQAEGQLPQARVAREQAQAAAVLAVHELATLTGQGADGYASIQPPSMQVEAALPVPAELPINLLARRPDVQSALMTVDAADADRRAAKAAFYPDVNLHALAGIAAFGMSNLVQWSARGYGAGPFISLPLFDGGRLKAGYRASEAQLDAAIAGYDDTVLRAVQQTADQITGLDALARERTDQQQTLEATEAAYKLAEERYRAGLASYLTVLNAETQVLAARQGMVDILASQAAARVTLLLAVGGSFDARSPGALAAAGDGGSHATLSSRNQARTRP
ncbi:MAG TPA: efflux transporter outer membrane subunit [Steroidobacteraceae bacterium]|jgi:NodT family efflux transporter outer membrane factor (OMF) lipoprotein|nr:efflux transporter outer membrane subunit [Steroidobacteraceae bacterium]